MFDEFIITLDVDWISDPVIEMVADMLLDFKIRSTWFATHDSKAIRRLLDHPEMFEVGIHPNFHEGSTQGSTPVEIMHNLKRTFPTASSVRCHGLMQSTSLLHMMAEDFDIFTETSIFLPKTPGIVPHELHTSKKVSLIRLPFFWEDDFEMYAPLPSFSITNEEYHVPGLKIFNFHAIHIALNSFSMNSYNECKTAVNINSLHMADLLPFQNTKQEGTQDLFIGLLQQLKDLGIQGLTISEAARAWKAS